MKRRSILVVAPAITMMLSACMREDSGVQMDAREVLEFAGLTVPDAEAEVIDGPRADELDVAKVVRFSAPAAIVEDWILENFASGIQSHAYKDDMEVALEKIGKGVQKKGDRIAGGIHEGVGFQVVVGHGDEPVVHVGVQKSR